MIENAKIKSTINDGTMTRTMIPVLLDINSMNPASPLSLYTPTTLSPLVQTAS